MSIIELGPTDASVEFAKVLDVELRFSRQVAAVKILYSGYVPS